MGHRINYQYNWGINWFNTAQVTLQAMICIQLYDNEWHPIRNDVWDFDTYTMANINTSWPGNQPPSVYGVFGTANPTLQANIPIAASPELGNFRQALCLRRRRWRLLGKWLHEL